MSRSSPRSARCGTAPRPGLLPRAVLRLGWHGFAVAVFFKNGYHECMAKTKEEIAAYQAEYRKRNAEKRKAYQREYYQANRDTAIAKSKQRYAENREQIIAQVQQRREKNLEAHRAKDRAYYETHREERLAYLAEWRAANPERVREGSRRWYEANREYAMQLAAEYRAANPERVREKGRRAQHRRRAKIAGSESPGVTRAQWAEIVEYFGGCCAYCLAPADSCDHIEPIATGGLDAPDNVVPACLRCNQSKGAKSLLFWLLTSQYARDVTAGRPMIFSESDRAVP